MEESQDPIMFTDGSRGEDSRVAERWSKGSFKAEPRSGQIEYLGKGATVYRIGRWLGGQRTAHGIVESLS